MCVLSPEAEGPPARRRHEETVQLSRSRSRGLETRSEAGTTRSFQKLEGEDSSSDSPWGFMVAGGPCRHLKYQKFVFIITSA